MWENVCEQTQEEKLKYIYVCYTVIFKFQTFTKNKLKRELSLATRKGKKFLNSFFERQEKKEKIHSPQF